ncbi:MAG: hypothetical protein JOZ72_07685 [Alphaproteobacteria bacterium]|nr:hypothetical protein [Alphaproteobacteria bacterium]
MKPISHRSVRNVVLCAALAACSRAAANPVHVVDIIPPTLNSETNRDSEPFIAVNPANPEIIAIDAFMPTPMGSANGPLMVSTDGGTTWSPNDIIPSASGISNTADMTMHFDTSGNWLYAGILQANAVSYTLNVLTTNDMTLTTPMTVVTGATMHPIDQPYASARTVNGWYDAGKNRVWIGNRNFNFDPKGASIDVALDAATAMPSFTEYEVDPTSPYYDIYQNRTAAAADGHVYGAYYRWQSASSGGHFTADVVVVRDDNWGNGATPFTALTDSAAPHPAGQRVVAGTSVSDSGGSSATLGNEWLTGDLFVAVDPNNSAHVYVSYSDANPGDNTLHLVRSLDYGQTWNPVLTASLAHNAAVAINSRGDIAYLYQALTGAVGSHHWETHLRRSYDDGMSFDDATLSDFPGEGAHRPSGGRIIGDYLGMQAVGKNFYGVFSAWNDLTYATFPQSVTFLRNKTPDGSPMPNFLQTDNMTIVPSSIDPFFFKTTELAANQDFYVRDWTDSASSHDRGQEPSSHGDFFSTSDVWNERSNDPLSFDGSDRPQSHDPQPTMTGPNYAFARIGREATGVAEDVALQFYYSDGGVGVNFLDAGSATSVHFNAGDAVKAPAAGDGVLWQLPSGASNHVCLASEISVAGVDPIVQPSLYLHAPGWPTTDLAVMGDNNKAQRNMQVFGYGGMAAGDMGMSMYAVVHNAATVTRDMPIAVTTGSRRSDDAAKNLVVATVAGDDRRQAMARPGGVMTLTGMRPGENRWVEFRFKPGDAPAKLEILELVDNRAVNGYAFAPQPMALPLAIRETLLQHAAVFARLDAFGIDGARDQVKLAQMLLKDRDVAPKAYAAFLQKNADAVEGVLSRFVQKARIGDPVSAGPAFDALVKALGNPAAAQALHLTLLNKIDVLATMRQKQEGDIADIAQDLRWQKELFVRLREIEGANEIVKRSDEFLTGLARRRIPLQDFVKLTASLSGAYRSAAAKLGGDAPARAEALAQARTLVSLQKAQREFLLAVADRTARR